MVGSSNAINALKNKFKKLYSIPMYPSSFNGIGFFLGYFLYLFFSFLALIWISQKDNCSVLSVWAALILWISCFVSSENNPKKIDFAHF